MTDPNSAAFIVARFLKANHYDQTLAAFLLEAELEPTAGDSKDESWTLEKILEEKKVFDLSLKFEKLGDGDERKGWSLPAPYRPAIISSIYSNILHVSIHPGGSRTENQVLLVTTSDRRLNKYVTDRDFPLLSSSSDLHDSPILSCQRLGTYLRQTVTASMSGQVILHDGMSNKTFEQRRDHNRYVYKTALWEKSSKSTSSAPTLLATAGWDGKVYVYAPTKDEDAELYTALNDPIATLTLPTNPEDILFVEDPDTSTLHLIVTRRDSTSLHYYNINNHSESSSLTSKPNITVTPSGSQNLAPHSTTWATFSPSSIALCPEDPTLLAVATSSLPHMKLLLVRLLFPPLPSSTAPPPYTPAPPPLTQASQTQESLARQDREEQAILLHVNTRAPQTPYSTPQVVWRPDGTGLWVNGDDGSLRGVDRASGKVIVTLGGGHEAGSKIRCIWAGMVGSEEWLVSGGFDHRVVVWRWET